MRAPNIISKGTIFTHERIKVLFSTHIQINQGMKKSFQGSTITMCCAMAEILFFKQKCRQTLNILVTLVFLFSFSSLSHIISDSKQIHRFLVDMLCLQKNKIKNRKYKWKPHSSHVQVHL